MPAIITKLAPPINSMPDMDESIAREMNGSEALTSLGRGKNVAVTSFYPTIASFRQADGVKLFTFVREKEVK